MVAAHQLHQGSNLRGHLVGFVHSTFNAFSIRNVPVESEMRDTYNSSGHKCPDLYMERNAMSRSEFRKLVSPLVRSGHLIKIMRRVQNQEPLRKIDGNQAQLPKKIS